MKKTNRNLFDKIRESFGNLVKRIAEYGGIRRHEMLLTFGRIASVANVAL